MVKGGKKFLMDSSKKFQEKTIIKTKTDIALMDADIDTDMVDT